MVATTERVISGLLLAFIVILLYTLLHEGGHALAVSLFGGRVIHFSLDFLTGSPHIRYVGSFSRLEKAVISLAGPGLPYLFWLVTIPLYSRCRGFPTKILALFYSIMMIGTFGAQVALSLMHLAGVRFAGEDINLFILYSGVSPILVLVILLALFLVSAIYVARIGNFGRICLSVLQQLEVASPFSGYFRLARSLALLLLLCVGLTFLPKEATSPQVVPLMQESRYLQFSGLGYGVAPVYAFETRALTALRLAYSIETRELVTLRLINQTGGGFPFTQEEYLLVYAGNKSLAGGDFHVPILYPGEYRLEIETGDRSGFVILEVNLSSPTQEDMSHLEAIKSLKTNLSTD